MSTLDDEITAAIDAKDPVRLAAILRGVPESRRRALHKTIQERVRDTFDYRREHTALGVAALGVAQGPQQAARVLERIDLSDHAQLAARVLAERQPHWLEGFSHKAISGRSALDGGWRIVRALVRAGVVPRPDLPEYITHISFALGGTYAADPTIRDGLLADPDLLQDEIFELFSVAGAAAAMHTVDGYAERPRGYPLGPEPVSKPHLTWRVTLAGLADEGHIDRARLLDACLGAFLCDLPPTQLGWYVGFHDELKPTLDELAERTGTYLLLLAADAGHPVALAQRVVKALLTSGRLDASAFVSGAEPPLHRREKKHVIAQLRLLDQIARRNPALADQIAVLIAVARAASAGRRGRGVDRIRRPRRARHHRPRNADRRSRLPEGHHAETGRRLPGNRSRVRSRPRRVGDHQRGASRPAESSNPRHTSTAVHRLRYGRPAGRARPHRRTCRHRRSTRIKPAPDHSSPAA
jgi:hypothetical protein